MLQAGYQPASRRLQHVLHQVSDFNIVGATPYGKDILARLVEEYERQGIGLFFLLFTAELAIIHADGQAGGTWQARQWELE